MFAACKDVTPKPTQTPGATIAPEQSQKPKNPPGTPDDPDDPQQPDYNIPDELDLSVNPLLYSIATDNYGAKANLTVQSEVALNGNALKNSIPDNTQYDTGYGSDKYVWSWLCIPIDDIFDEDYLDIKDKYLTFCVKFENSYQRMSVIIEDINGVLSSEYGFAIDDNIYDSVCSSKYLGNGWYKVYLRFLAAGEGTFGQREYPQGTKFDITKTKNSQMESTVYIDNMYLTEQIDSGYRFAQLDVYPPNSDAATETDILFIGNSFIYSSDVAYILQSIANENGKPLHLESYSKGNGYVYQLYGIALEQYNNNEPDTWGNKLFRGEYDILIIQAIFGNDSNGVQSFYNKLKELNINTEIILMPADNEGDTAEVFYASNSDKYGLINWRQLVITLKDSCGLTNWDLNQAADDWHANALSGYAVSVAIYYYLYGEMPQNLNLTHRMLMDGYYIAGSSINSYNFTMRGTEQEKLDRFALIRTAAKNMIDNYY
jgi:hypothetical protein